MLTTKYTTYTKKVTKGCGRARTFAVVIAAWTAEADRYPAFISQVSCIS